MMVCRRCQSVLTQRNRAGEPIIRTRGIVLKKTGFVLVCPSCKGDVIFDPKLLTILLSSPAALTKSG